MRDKDLERLLAAAKVGGRGVDLGKMSDAEILRRLLGREAARD